MVNLAVVTDEAGQIDEAEQWYRRASEAGSRYAALHFARLLIETGRSDEAEQWLQPEADPQAMVAFAETLDFAELFSEAEPWYRMAAENGYAELILQRGIECRDIGCMTGPSGGSA